MLDKPIMFHPNVDGATYRILAVSTATCHIFPITSNPIVVSLFSTPSPKFKSISSVHVALTVVFFLRNYGAAIVSGFAAVVLWCGLREIAPSRTREAMEDNVEDCI